MCLCATASFPLNAMLHLEGVEDDWDWMLPVEPFNDLALSSSSAALAVAAPKLPHTIAQLTVAYRQSYGPDNGGLQAELWA